MPPPRLPTERIWRDGGAMHGVQLWVNLPAALKFQLLRCRAITADQLRLITSADGGAVVRIIVGDVGEFSGPASPTRRSPTHTAPSPVTSGFGEQVRPLVGSR